MEEREALRLLELDKPFHGEPPEQVGARVVGRRGVLANVAVSLPLTYDKGRLARLERSPGGRGEPATPMLCIAYGPLVQAPDGRLGFASLQVGPILTPRPAPPVERFPDVPFRNWLPDPSIPVTAGLLRLFRPEWIVTEAVAQLRQEARWRSDAERAGRAGPMSDRQVRAYRQLRSGRPASARPTEREIELIARRYVQLVAEEGERRPLPRMAEELGLSREQVRDRVHRARVLKYLQPTRQGRVSAEPGPRLLKLRTRRGKEK